MNDHAPLVVAALKQVAELRSSELRGDDAVVCRLLAAYGEGKDLANELWADLPDDRALEDVADLLSLWSWRTNDNGSAIMRTLESWVRECSDESKIWVALHQDAFPFISHADRILHLANVVAEFPALGPRCEVIVLQSQAWLRRSGRADRTFERRLSDACFDEWRATTGSCYSGSAVLLLAASVRLPPLAASVRWWRHREVLVQSATDNGHSTAVSVSAGEDHDFSFRLM